MNWRLLFDIALGYGESLSTLKLTYPGFISFLRAIELLGVKSGVYPVLIEKLWGHHAILPSFADKSSDMFDESIECLDKTPLDKRQPAYDIKRKEVMKLGICGFEGFTDMMNVICVRCCQSKKCLDLFVKNHESMVQAILLSAEDVMTLPESVRYTSQKYFKPFIARNVVRRSTKMVLDPMVNEWTQHTNSLITHVVGSLLKTVVLPLFRRYSQGGLTSLKNYLALVDELFHTFSANQRAAALSIFSCEDFFDVYELLRYSRVSLEAEKVSHRSTLTFESFVQALLMLGLVAYADETRFLHYRSLTAKVWAVFEEVYCRAVVRTAMAEEPSISGRFESILPVISFVSPHYVPVERVTSFLIGGLNLHSFNPVSANYVKNDDTQVEASLAALLDGRLIQFPKAQQEVVTSGADLTRKDSLLFSETDSTESPGGADDGAELETVGTLTVSSPMGQKQASNDGEPENTIDVPPGEEVAPSSASMKGELRRRFSTQKKALDVTSVPNTAMSLINKEFETQEFSQFDSPIYGARVSNVYVNEYCVPTIDHGKNHVEVLLSPPLCKPENFRMSVRLEENVDLPGVGLRERSSGFRFVFLPIRRVTVSLRSKAGDVIYSSTDLVLHMSPAYQVIPNTQIGQLREVFDKYAAEKDREHGEGVLARAQLTSICKGLGLIRSQTAAVAFEGAIQNYFDVQLECDPKTLGLDNIETIPQLTEPSSSQWITFHDFMCIIAHLAIHQAGTTTAVPNVVSFLSAAMKSNSGSTLESLVSGNKPGSATSKREKEELHPLKDEETPHSAVKADNSILPTIPYNALIEVPYQNAMKKKIRNIEESSEAAELFMYNIHSSGKEKASKGLFQCELPPFPSDIQTKSMVSQYEENETEGVAKEVLNASMQILDEYMKEEIDIEDP